MKKILYVEDNEDTAEAVKFILESEGYSVDLAFNGKSGLKSAKSGKYDIILLDIMLPDMSGWDIYDKIHDSVKARYAFLSAIPVSSERLAELKKSGISDYIMKPFTKADLVNKVKNMVKP